MLKVLRYQPDCCTGNIEIDPYVPLKIRWEEIEDCAEDLIYWRTGDLKQSLFELGLSLSSGRVISLTVVHAHMIVIEDEKRYLNVRIHEGMPLFDTSNWSDLDMVDDEGVFEIHLCDDEVFLVLRNVETVDAIQSGRILFGFDVDSNLSLIRVKCLTKNEKSLLKDTLFFLKEQNG